MRRVIWGLCLLVLGCAPAPAASGARAVLTPDDPVAEVLAAAERLLLALRDRDTATLRELMDAGARFYSVRLDGATPQLSIIDAEEFLSVVSASPEPLVERIWNPRVEVSGPLASLWAAYDFHVGARFSHCGQAAFHFVLRDGTWRLTAETYTVQMSSCDPPP